MRSRTFSDALKKMGLTKAIKPNDWRSWTFSQKISWRCRNPDPTVDYLRWTDKLLVKQVVAEYFHVAKTYFATTEVKKIDLRNLPDTFVMKATHGWNMSLLVEDGIVKGGNRVTEPIAQKCDSNLLRLTASRWFSSKEEKKRQRGQKQYKFLEPGIIFEEYLNPIDYELQLFLFDGKYQFGLVLFRQFHHSDVLHQLYDENWVLLDPGSSEFADLYLQSDDRIAPPPQELLRMLYSLCEKIDHVRADFFVSDGKYYFSEFTFTHNGGKGAGFIGKYDAELGLFWGS